MEKELYTDLKEIEKEFKTPVNCLESREDQLRQNLVVKTAGMKRELEIAAAEVVHGP